jgi:hypothetical protein
MSGLEKLWLQDTAHGKFWRRLLNENVDRIVRDQKHLKTLRFRNDIVKRYQKRFGHVFEERGLNLYQLIAESYDECWDSEDEEKSRSVADEKVASLVAKEKNPDSNALSLDHPREVCVRSGQEEELGLQVRSGDEGCEGHLQEEGLSSKGGGGCSPEEEAPG